MADSRLACTITQDPIRLDELSAFVADPGAGALATFVGTTRDTNDGRRVIRLEYECYPGMAEKEMAKIGHQVLERWPVKKSRHDTPARSGRYWRGQCGHSRVFQSSPRRV